MPQRRHFTIYPSILNTLWQSIHEVDGLPIKALYGFALGFAIIWLLIICAAPIILFLVVFGIANYTVEWLYISKVALISTLIFILLTIIAVSLWHIYISRESLDKTKSVLGIFISLISILSIGWFLFKGELHSSPVSEQVFTLLAGSLISVLFAISVIYDFVKNKQLSFYLRFCKVVIGLVFSLSLLSGVLMPMLSLPYSVEKSFWRDLSSYIQIFGFPVYFIISAASAKPVSTSVNWKRVLIVVITGAFILFAVFICFEFNNLK